MRSLIPAAAAFALAACQAASTRGSFDVTIAVASDDGSPLAGVAVAAGDAVLGRTGPDGALPVTLHAEDGTRMTVRPVCPEGFHEADDGALLVLRRFHGLEAGRSNELSLALECRPRERTAVLVVRADGRADLPVLVDGEPAARTNAEGVAHLALRRPSNTTLRVALDTSAHPRLQPQNPEVPFVVGEADEIFVLDQSFEQRKAKRHRRRRRRVEAPARPKGPIKIESTSKRRWRSL